MGQGSNTKISAKMFNSMNANELINKYTINQSHSNFQSEIDLLPFEHEQYGIEINK